MAENLVAVVNPDGTLVGSAASGTQPVSGTVTSNAGTGPSVANSWNVKITDGVDIAPVSTSTLGNQLLGSTGCLTAGKSLAAVVVNTTGTTVDFGSAKNNFTGMVVITGTLTTATVTLELSLDNVTWASSTVSTVATTAGTYPLYSIGRPARYARVTLSAYTGTATVTADIMGA